MTWTIILCLHKLNEKAYQTADALETGMVSINTPIVAVAEAPLGINKVVMEEKVEAKLLKIT